MTTKEKNGKTYKSKENEKKDNTISDVNTILEVIKWTYKHQQILKILKLKLHTREGKALYTLLKSEFYGT